MSGVPDGWAARKVGELADVARGSSPRPIADQRYFDDGDIPWIKIADATKSGKYLYDTKEKVNEFGASFSKRLPAGSLIIAASGTLGYPQMLGVPGCVHDGWLYLTNFRDVDRHFLYYFFHWKKQHFYNSAYGAAIQNINTEILRNTEISLPPLRVQQRISSILSAYDDLIENNIRRIKTVEEIAQMIYREWFGNFRFPGHEKTEMIESGIGPIPKGWRVALIQDIAEVNEQSLTAENGVEEIVYIDIASVSTACIDSKVRVHLDVAPSRARRIVRHGDIIWSSVRPNRRSYALVLDPEPNLIVSTGFAVLTPHKVPYSYLYFATTTDSFAEYLTNHATGAAYPAVNTEDFEKARLLLPPKVWLDRFHSATVDMLRLRHSLQLQNLNLRTTRDLLLPKLISGEISLDHVETEAVAQGV
jgi:type I restriction enzyme S subunit